LPCYALTNMEAETYPLRVRRVPFLTWFDGTLVSGQEGTAKPDPDIFLRLLDRYALDAPTTLMIDDTSGNIDAAGRLGMQTILFRSHRQLRMELEAAGVLRPLTPVGPWTGHGSGRRPQSLEPAVGIEPTT
jgi:2-haloacid dehalogenase